LLQLLDDGTLTDSLGRKVDFKNTIVIMTSNIGSRQLKDFGTGVGFNTAAKVDNEGGHSRSVIEGALKKAFAPEFLNRIDDVVIFNSLSREDIHKIIDIELNHLYKRVEDLGYKLKLTEKAKDFISEKGYDSSFGARPLKRAIQKYVEDPLAEEIIKAELVEGDIIEVDLAEDNESLLVNVNKPAKSGRKKKEEN
jgi:ATP-dependent Clp protease ATP-binding subunit ClpC